jgi:hypothetical protein
MTSEHLRKHIMEAGSAHATRVGMCRQKAFLQLPLQMHVVTLSSPKDQLARTKEKLGAVMMNSTDRDPFRTYGLFITTENFVNIPSLCSISPLNI